MIARPPRTRRRTLRTSARGLRCAHNAERNLHFIARAPTARPLPQYDEKGNKQEKPDIKACAPPCCICCGPQRDDPLWCHCCMCCRGPKTVTADTKVGFNECCECDCIENNCGPRYAGCQLCCCHCTCLRCPAGCQNKCCCEEERMMMDGDLVPFPKEPSIQEMDRT